MKRYGVRSTEYGVRSAECAERGPGYGTEALLA